MLVTQLQGLSRLVISQNKLNFTNPTCATLPKTAYCQDYNLTVIPITNLNITVKNCMENFYVYAFPPANIDPTNIPAITFSVSLLPGKHLSTLNQNR